MSNIPTKKANRRSRKVMYNADADAGNDSTDSEPLSPSNPRVDKTGFQTHPAVSEIFNATSQHVDISEGFIANMDSASLSDKKTAPPVAAHVPAPVVATGHVAHKHPARANTRDATPIPALVPARIDTVSSTTATTDTDPNVIKPSVGQPFSEEEAVVLDPKSLSPEEQSILKSLTEWASCSRKEKIRMKEQLKKICDGLLVMFPNKDAFLINVRMIEQAIILSYPKDEQKALGKNFTEKSTRPYAEKKQIRYVVQQLNKRLQRQVNKIMNQMYDKTLDIFCDDIFAMLRENPRVFDEAIAKEDEALAKGSATRKANKAANSASSTNTDSASSTNIESNTGKRKPDESIPQGTGIKTANLLKRQSDDDEFIDDEDNNDDDDGGCDEGEDSDGGPDTESDDPDYVPLTKNGQPLIVLKKTKKYFALLEESVSAGSPMYPEGEANYGNMCQKTWNIINSEDVGTQAMVDIIHKMLSPIYVPKTDSDTFQRGVPKTDSELVSTI